MGQLVIHRTKALWQDRGRDYIIFVDGKKVGQVGNGAEVRTPLDPGIHKVRLKIDWCRSPALQVEAKPGKVIHLECGPNANPFLMLIYVTFWMGKYIWLRQPSHPAANQAS